MSAVATTIQLPEQLDFPAASALRAELLAVRGTAVEVNGSAVNRLGALCLQVLLSAAGTWRADGQDFRIVDPSGALQDGFQLLGATMPSDQLEGVSGA